MNQRGWRLFLTLCSKAEDEKILAELFDFFLTPEEKSSIASRCLIVKNLMEGKIPQRQISENLEVSIAKITRGSNELKRISPKFKQFLLKYIL